MNLTISGHHLDVTPALREYVLTKLDRQVVKHKDRLQDHHHAAAKRLDADVV